LCARMSNKTADDYIRYMDKYLSDVIILDRLDIADISMTVKHGWNWYAKSVRNYINFLEDKGLISVIQAHDLKQPLKLKRPGQDTWVPPTETINYALKTCENDMNLMIFKILLYSGIRETEAKRMIETFEDRKLHIKGDVAYYDIDWSRGSKNANKAFMPADFARTLRHEDNINLPAIQKYFQRTGLPLKYCRNFFIDQCVQAEIHESLIQYMIGHVGGSVLMTNYLDKLNNSIKSYPKVMPNLRDIIEA
jgi:intergrase/recombinase